MKTQQNRPTPFDEATTISWFVNETMDYKNARLRIHTPDGKILLEEEVRLDIGMNEFAFTYGYMYEGICYYSMIVDNKIIDSKAMIFAY